MNPHLTLPFAVVTAFSALCALLAPRMWRVRRSNQKRYTLWLLLTLALCCGWIGLYRANQPYQMTLKQIQSVEAMNSAF